VHTSYAIVWREDDRPSHAGKLELRARGLRLEGNGESWEVPFEDIASLRVGRGSDDRLVGRPALVVERRNGRALRIATMAEVGALAELVERIAGFGVHEASSKRLLVVAPLRPGSREQVRALLQQGPPFDPEAVSLAQHEVFLTDREALFLFEVNGGPADVGRLLGKPSVWKATAAWSKHLAGPPRVAEVVYAWRRPRPDSEPADAASA
jgi:hypothetical protein